MKQVYIIILILSSLDISAQCFPDRHSTTWYDAWVSCEKTENPNPERSASHWILYDLSTTYELGKSHFWNINDPSHLDFGIRKALIDLSVDGVQWTFADTLYLNQGPGSSIYEGEEALDLDGAPAQFVLITVLETYGHGECAGFAELRMEREQLTTGLDEVLIDNGCLDVQILPNPFQDKALCVVSSSCSTEANYIVTNALGQVVQNGNISLGNGQSSFYLGEGDFPVGQYLLTVRQNQSIHSVPFSKTK